MSMYNSFHGPRTVDGDALEKMIVKSYMGERKRRKKSVDDEYRYDIDNSGLPTGEFDLSQISPHDGTIQERYFNQYGGVAPRMNTNYVCPHCRMEYAAGFPPEFCKRCHKITYFGEMVRDGVFKR